MSTHNESDMQELFGAAHTVTVHGESVCLRPITLGQMPRLLRLAQPLIREFRERRQAQSDQQAEAAELIVTVDVFDLLARHGDTLLDLCALLCDRDRAWLDALSLDDAALLIAEVVAVNRDFFTSRLLPLIGRLIAPSPTIGASPTQTQTQSPAQTHTDSAGPTPSSV